MLSRLLLHIALLFACVGCSRMFLFPDRLNYFPEVQKALILEEGFFDSDGEKLHFWFVPAQKRGARLDSKGLVIQVHGNAQNLSSHVQSLIWLTEEGYDVFTFDYRGYGRSTGKASLSGAFKDVATALDFATKSFTANAMQTQKVVRTFFYGQSLGGTLLLKNLSVHQGRWRPDLVIVESSFFSYRQIAREKMNEIWLTWPFQWLAYVFFPGRYSLEEAELAQLNTYSKILFYSENDPIVPFHNGERIFRSLAEPKSLHRYPEPGHIAAMWVQKGALRKVLLEKMAQ